MEILTIGEKIKRARIYKGYTLKDIGGEILSVSKLSCIENNKIKADSDTIAYIADKLDSDVTYISEDIEQQLMKNLERLKNEKLDNYVKWAKYNLSYAEEHSYSNIAVEILHNLFKYHLQNNDLDKVDQILTKYYGLVLKSKNHNKLAVFNLDMASYLFYCKEYDEAISYCERVRHAQLLSEEIAIIKSEAVFCEVSCYMQQKKFPKIETILTENYISDADTHAQFNKILLATAKIYNGSLDADKFEAIALTNVIDLQLLITAMLDFSEAYFAINNTKRGQEYLQKTIDLLEGEGIAGKLHHWLKVLSIYMSIKNYLKAENIIENILNEAILEDNAAITEKCYYYKALIYDKNKDLLVSEISMNLSIDFLRRNGNSEVVKNRYLELGSIYYKYGSLKDCLECYSTAILGDKVVK